MADLKDNLPSKSAASIPGGSSAEEEAYWREHHAGQTAGPGARLTAHPTLSGLARLGL